MTALYGSICLSDIDRSVMKRVRTKDGEKVFVNVFIGERRNPVTFGDRTYTHYVSCAPPKEEREEGKYYNVGDLMEFKPAPSVPSPEDVNNAPAVGPEDDLPF